MSELLLTALVVGFLGGVHCLGMCGPLAGAFTFSLSHDIQIKPLSVARMQLAYNLGRITIYAVLGAVAGIVGMVLVEAGSLLSVQRWLLAFAGLWMLILAAWLVGWSSLPSRLEHLAGGWWGRFSSRWRSRFLPVRRLSGAYFFGLIWGCLPCGLVYSTLLLALSSSSWLEGGLVMLAFGLGTLPNLMLMGVSAFWLTRLQQQRWLRRTAAAGIALFGALTIWQALMSSVWAGVV
jgi:sulfite exporter TauE/SafE